MSPESPERSRWKSESTLKQLIFISITVALALGIASCGAEEIAQVDAEYELEQRAQIDAAIADLEALKADPRRAQVASDAIDRYLFAKREVRRFNRAVRLDDAPPGSPTVIADDRFLDPARREVPSLFGPDGQAIVPADLRRFRRAVSDDPADALRPVVAGPVELLMTRARLSGLDATYPDDDGLTRREVIADAASVLEPFWPGLAAELERVLGAST